MESWASSVRETLEDLAPEEYLRSYTLLRLCVRFRPDWPLDMSGFFAEEVPHARPKRWMLLARHVIDT